MPGPLTLRKRDPNAKKRGRGYYYHRGNGIYSKYQGSRFSTKDNPNKDWKRKANTKRPSGIARDDKYAHTRDGKRRRV